MPDSPSLSREVPAWLHVGGSCAQNESCNVPCSDWHSLLHALQGAPRFPLMDPTHGTESGGHQAGQEDKSYQLEATSPGGTSISHNNWKCCFPFPQMPHSHISSGKWYSHRADGLMVTQQLLNQVKVVKHKPPPYPTLFHGGTHMRRDSRLQQCLVNTPHSCSHHDQAQNPTHTWLLSLHDQHRLSARATLLLPPAHPLSCSVLFPVTPSLCCSI